MFLNDLYYVNKKNSTDTVKLKLVLKSRFTIVGHGPLFVMSPVSLQSVSIHWDHPDANQSLQSICLPLEVDLLQGRARLCTFEIRQGYFRDHTCRFQSGAAIGEIPPRWGLCNLCQCRRCPLAEHLFHSLSHLYLSLDRTTQTKWPSKWAVACLLWNKFSRSSRLPPHLMQFLVSLSSECHHQIVLF